MRKFGSDLVVDLLRAHGIDRVAMNPGASYRGLHDSLVNYGDWRPDLIVCTNEKIVVNVAHGFAKVTGEPMVAIVHDVVGLMQGTMGVYTAYVDREPVIVLGGTGPMATSLRRPHIEWVHTAVTQGEFVRGFVKWDDQPFDVEGIVDGFARGHQIATTQPQGPVYLCYDLGLQEAELDEEPALAVHRARPQFAAEAAAVEEIAELLVSAEQPVIVAGRVGRRPEVVDHLATLAELVAAPVVDLDWRFNLPNTHPLHFRTGTPLDGADTVLALDVADLYGAVTAADEHDGARRLRPRADARLVEVRLDLLESNGWLPLHQKYQPVDVSLLADTALLLPALVEAVRRRGVGTSADDRRRVWSARHDDDRAGSIAAAREGWEATPISTARFAVELERALEGIDYVLAGSTLAGWTRRLWSFTRWGQHFGRPLGTGTQIGTSMGVALAHADAEPIVVAIQPDGDLLFDPGALWTIAANGWPMLIVMFNNRSYYNDVEHQLAVARRRGRDESRAHVGMDLGSPATDFAAAAAAFGLRSFGQITDPGELQPLLRQAALHVARTREPALVDVIAQFR